MKPFVRRTTNGVEEIQSFKDYVTNYKQHNSNIEIVVGTDSKQAGTKTMYVTTICFRHERKGVHVIYRKEIAEKIKDIFTRLFKEAEMSRAIVDELDGRNDIAIHLDYSLSKNRKSSNACQAAMDWLKSSGYKVVSKPDAYAASAAADAILHIKSKRPKAHQRKKKK